MSQFIESLRRLYMSGRLTMDKITDLYNSKKISLEEMSYITNAR